MMDAVMRNYLSVMEVQSGSTLCITLCKISHTNG